MLALVFLLAFLIRLISLNQSLWLDEATTARALQQFDLGQIVSQFAPRDFHPPLYYLLMKLWSSLFGYSEIALRAPSVLFSLGTGWFVYLIGKKLKSETIGLWAAAFFLFNPMIIYYSQEARMYMMVTFILTVALYFYIKLTGGGGGGTRQFILFNILIFLSFLTFYGSIFFIAAMYLYLLFKKQYKLLFQFLPGFVLALLIISPLLVQQYMNSREQLGLVVNWRNVLGTVNLKNLLLIPLKFSIGRISWEPKSVYYAVAGLWTAFVILEGTKNLVKRKLDLSVRRLSDFRMTLIALFIVPLILGAIFSFFSPLLQYFRFIYLIPLMALLVAIGTNRQWQKTVLLAGFVTFSLIYLFNPNFHREDWKSLAGELGGGEKVYMIPSSSDPLLYYKKVDVQDMRNIKKVKEKEIIVIPYTADIYGFNYRERLRAENFVQTETKTVRGLSWERWTKKAP